MVNIKQYYGIKYPFTAISDDGFFVDLNSNLNEKVASEILHTILTTKGTRLRMPEFGTRLIDYVFGQQDETTWASVENEVKDAVRKYVKNANITDIKVYMDDEDSHGIYLDINYGVTYGTSVENNRILVKI